MKLEIREKKELKRNIEKLNELITYYNDQLNGVIEREKLLKEMFSNINSKVEFGLESSDDEDMDAVYTRYFTVSKKAKETKKLLSERLEALEFTKSMTQGLIDCADTITEEDYKKWLCEVEKIDPEEFDSYVEKEWGWSNS